MGEWDMRKILNNADRLAEFDDFVTNFFETIMSRIRKEHDKRKENGQAPVTQMTMLIEVKNYAYMQLIHLSGKKDYARIVVTTKITSIVQYLFAAIKKLLHLAVRYYNFISLYFSFLWLFSSWKFQLNIVHSSQSMYESHYPEILYRAVFINCPQFFGLFMAMLKPILAPKTMGKLTCYSEMSEWQKELKELIDPMQIPEQYGGSKKV